LKWLTTILLILVTFYAAQAQRNYVYGSVADSLDGHVLIGAHIQNIDAGSLTSTNEDGKFKIPVKVGDTLIISSVGYLTLAWVAQPDWFRKTEVEFKLPSNTVYLDEVVVGQFPEYLQFKDDLINMNVEDTSFQIFGIPKVVNEPQSENASIGISGPVSAIYKKFSKREKEKRKMQMIERRRHLTTKANLKFTREWVSQNTGLEGDTLTDFIAYCDFSVDYLAGATEFDIQQRMMDLLPSYKKQMEEKDESKKG